MLRVLRVSSMSAEKFRDVNPSEDESHDSIGARKRALVHDVVFE